MLKRISLLILLFLSVIVNTQGQDKQAVDLVYPLLDAANSRWFYFSSASRPFGMVSLFPDNAINGAWNSGYRYQIDTVKSLSHIHEWQLAGVAVMPVSFSGTDLSAVFANYESHFSHDTETVKPGYHALTLSRYDTKVELTASERVGFHRYHFPDGKQKSVLFELGGQLGPSEMIEGGFEQVSDREIRGYTVNGPTSRRPKPYPVYFSAVFNQPIKKIYLYNGGEIKEDLSGWNGSDGKVLVVLEDQMSQPVLMKVGISYTSEEGAANNRQKEIPHWEFMKTRQEARQHWNSMLSRIKIEGGSEQQQRRFYTDLWHAIQGRRQISDADGKYADFTREERIIRQVPLIASGKPKFNMYNSDSFWGAQWTLNTLWQLVYPEIAEEFCNSFLEYYKNGGLIPRGPSGGNYTFVMTGAQTTPFYVSAWQKGIRGFDIDLAYEGLRKNHMPGGMMSKVGYEHNTFKGGGIEYYIDKGYVPYPLSDTVYGGHQAGAANTLENAYQDWCLAQLAKALNKKADDKLFSERSRNFRNLYNSAEGFMVPKDKEGRWKSSFDPLLYQNGYVEGNGAQFTWFVPHDLPALFTLMGGQDTAVARLNRQFELAQKYRFCDQHPEKEKLFFNDSRMWINYSNQPNMQAAFIFNYAGAPWLTQYWSRMVVDSVYSDLSPYYGYSGDEDQGLMGALSVLMKIGLFQMTGGVEENPRYEIGSPIFDKVTITLDPKYFEAKQFNIVANNTSAENKYISSAAINGNILTKFYINQSDFNQGSTLYLEMSDLPNKEWGLPGK